MKNMWLAPAYYADFVCKADKCRNTCCSKWRISVSHEEYNRLITMDCSEELDRKILNSFVMPETVSESRFRYIGFNWEGHCPMQKDGLCSIYLEMGEEYLPTICRLFPRSLKQINGINYACCSASCERVTELLFESDRLNLKKIGLNEKPQIVYQFSDEEERQNALFELLIKDESTTLAESITEICMIINRREFEKDEKSADDPLKGGLKLLKMLSWNNERISELTEYMENRYQKDPAVFENDKRSFESAYPDWMALFERLINNSMLYECYPFVDKRADKTKVYKGLCFLYGFLRMTAIAAHARDKSKEKLIDAISALFHIVDHTPFYYNVSLLEENAAVMLRL